MNVEMIQFKVSREEDRQGPKSSHHKRAPEPWSSRKHQALQLHLLAALSQGSSACSTAAGGCHSRAAAPCVLLSLPSTSASRYTPRFAPTTGNHPLPVLGPTPTLCGARLHDNHHTPGASTCCPGGCLRNGGGAAPPRILAGGERGQRGMLRGMALRCNVLTPLGRLCFALSGSARGRPRRVLPRPHPGRQCGSSLFRRHIGSSQWG